MKKPILLAAMLTVLLIAAATAIAQESPEEFTLAPEVQHTPSEGTCEWGPTELSSPENPYAPNAATPFDHVAGEFLVSYESEDAMWAAPQENMVHTHPRYAPDSPYLQLLRFENIASIPDPCERFATEEAKRQEILTWPGVEYATYNGYGYIESEPIEPG